MKFTDSEESFDAYYEFGGEKFASAYKIGDSEWRLLFKNECGVILDLEELVALQTLLAKAVIVEKQGKNP